MHTLTPTAHPDAVLQVWGTCLRAGDIAFTTLYKGTPTARAELPADVREAAEQALREHHPRHARYFLDGDRDNARQKH